MTTPIYEPAYHIFCDEYGDQSRSRKSSKIFLMSALVVATHRVEAELPRWTERINRRRWNWNGRPLHFIDLDEPTKLWASRFIGKLPVRCFVIASHKHSVHSYRNVRAERTADLRVYGDDGTSFTIRQRRGLWYPHIVLKVLLERATGWCEARGVRDYGFPRPVKITIAQRGGFYLDRFKTYLIEKDKVHWTNRGGTHHRYLAWSVVDPDLIETAPANDSAGLQLADVVSGSFSRAIDEHKFGRCDARFAMNFAWRLARKGQHRQIADWSVTALPWELWNGGLSHGQEDVYRSFGYADESLVRPGLILPDGC